MCDIYSGIGLDFHTVLKPSSSHVLVRNFTFENGLILGLYREVCNALVHLQLFFLKKKQKNQTNIRPIRHPDF